MILLFAFFMRVLGLYSSPLWYDEILSLHRARLPFWEHMQVHVNLWEIILRAFDTPLLIRIPSLVCSMLALWLAWRIMALLQFKRTQRMVAMTALAFMPGLLWMAQDARYYSGISLVYMASVYFALDGRWLGLIAVSGLAYFVHPTAPAYVLPAWMLSLWNLKWKTIHQVALSFILLPVIWKVLTIPDVNKFWIEDMSLSYIIRQYALSIGMAEFNIVPALALFGTVLGMAVISFNWRAWLIYLTPIVAILLVSVFIIPVAFYRTLQPSLMGLGILVGSAVPEKIRLPWLSPLAVLLVWMLAQYDPSIHAGHIDHGAAGIRAGWHDGDCIRYGDEFSETSMNEIAADLPACDGAAAREWIVTTTPAQADPFFVTNGWHFSPIYFYSP